MDDVTVILAIAGLGVGVFALRKWWYDIEDWFLELPDRFSERCINFLASLIASHISQLKREAREAGDKAGYERGLADGKVVWELRDHRLIPEPRGFDDSVYGPQRLRVSPDRRDQMRQEVAAAAAKRLISEPTDEQWDMILSDHPATCVLAGAGSGKSTTLALRVVFMLVHLKVPAGQITVVSFTNDSCRDLREKLVKLGEHWPASGLNKDVAKDLVRTFHSALSRMARAVMPNIKWFENVGRGKEQTDADSNDNPFASGVNQDQVDLVKITYLDLYRSDNIFREAVKAMLEIECENGTVAVASDGYQDKDWLIAEASKRDRQLADLLNERWTQKGYWPIDGIDPEPFVAFSVDGHPFHANGKVYGSEMPVFLGAGEDGWFAANETVGVERQFAVTGATGVKRNMVSWRLGREHAYIGSPLSLDRLALRIKHLNPARPSPEAPLFRVRLTGEKTYSELLAAFVSQASFIESMGMEVTEFVGDMEPFRAADIDHHFCTALARFWPRFEADLSRRGLMTFNRGFRSLSDALANPDRRRQLAPLRKPLTHLLIDEFQDISSQIVTWLQNAQRQLAIDNERPSIMAIGDDWQSIYGWRGSSPEFFIKFDDFFKVHPDLEGGESKKCPMGENFRSIPDIVYDGAAVLAPVSLKTNKSVCSNVRKESDDHGVRIVLQKDEEKDDAYMKKIAELTNEMYAQMQARSNGDKKKVLVMARSNTYLGEIQKRVGEKMGLSFSTIHRAKGLQAEAAIICEDCSDEGAHPIRDRVYALIEAFECKSYEDAQRDEALRLAYVAVTRGIRRVHWFAGKGQGAARLLAGNIT